MGQGITHRLTIKVFCKGVFLVKYLCLEHLKMVIIITIILEKKVKVLQVHPEKTECHNIQIS